MLGIQLKKNTSTSIDLDRNLTDFIKLLSCLMIALHHYSQVAIVSGYSNFVYQLFSTQGGYLGVAIFFFLSGYGLMKSDTKYHLSSYAFFKKRLLKTYLPAVLVSLLWTIYLIVVGGGNSLSWQTFDGIFWHFNDGVLWFVRAIVKLYALFYFYSWLSHKWPRVKILSLIVVSFLAFLWVRESFVTSSSLLLFFVGMSIVEFGEYWVKLIKKIYPVIILYVIIIALAFIERQNAEWIHLFINYICILTGIVFFICYDIKIKCLPHWMGNASYDIYLVHKKSIMFLRLEYSIVSIWMFIALSLVFTFVFNNIRRILKL